MEIAVFFFLSLLVPSSALKCYSCNAIDGCCDCDEDTNFGVEKECNLPEAALPACQIIKTSGDGVPEIMIRDCVDAESESSLECSESHDDGIHVHNCFCATDMCNKDWDTADGGGLTCYTCDSVTDSCDELTNVGTPTDCKAALPNATIPACQIIQMSGLMDRFIRSCADAESENVLICSDDHSGGLDVHHCMCNDNLCNLNFDTATPTTTQGPTITTQVPPVTTEQPPDGLQCYTCDSVSGNCDENNNVGISTNCKTQVPNAVVPACQILKTSGVGLPNVMVRNCIDAESESHLKCDEFHESGMGVHNCLCDRELCNLNWNTANGDGLKCYTCNSLSGSCDETDNVGASIDCTLEMPNAVVPACQIIKTSGAGLPNVMIRNCVDAESESHLECDEYHDGGVDVQNCICNTDNCNLNWDTADESLQCYTCDSMTGSCDLYNNVGTPTACKTVLPNALVPACQIIQSSGIVNRLVRNCADAESESLLTCDKAHDDGMDITNCLCDSSLCNLNFDTANGGTTHKPPVTTQQPPRDIQCYTCDSLSGSCDENDNVGKSTDCKSVIPEASLPACQIMKTSGAGLPNVIIRNCVDAKSEDLLECDEVYESGAYVHNCLCNSDLCNFNFDTADGGTTTQSPPQTTKPPNPDGDCGKSRLLLDLSSANGAEVMCSSQGNRLGQIVDPGMICIFMSEGHIGSKVQVEMSCNGQDWNVNFATATHQKSSVSSRNPSVKINPLAVGDCGNSRLMLDLSLANGGQVMCSSQDGKLSQVVDPGMTCIFMSEGHIGSEVQAQLFCDGQNWDIKFAVNTQFE